MKQPIKKAASLLLACALLLGLLPQQALAADDPKPELIYETQLDGLRLGLQKLDAKKAVYGVQLQLKLGSKLEPEKIKLEPADGLAFSPDHAVQVTVEEDETTVMIYLVSAYVMNSKDSLTLGDLIHEEDKPLKLKSAQVALVYSETFGDAKDWPPLEDIATESSNNVPDNPFSGNGDGSQGGDNDNNNNNGGGGGGGGAVSGTAYKIEVLQGVHGTLQLSHQSARQGQTVTITLKPDTGYRLESLTVADTTGTKIPVTGSGSQYTFRMPAAQVAVAAVFSQIDPETTPSPSNFTDVSPEDWFYEAVQYVCGKGMMNGMGEGAFAPDTTTSRAMIVTILYRLESQPQAAADGFTDVAAGQWYTDAVSWASANGIVTGYGEQRTGQFGPEDPITRQQMAAILLRYAKYKNYDVSAQGQLSAFSDSADIEPYALEAMGWANGAGLITGVTESTLMPAGNATRAQAAAILMRFCENIAR